MATDRRPAPSLVPAAEIALALLSVATVAGMWRLFVDGSFFWPVAGHALAAHAVAALCRRRGVSLQASAAITAGAAALALTWAHLADTTALGLPTGATLTGAADRLDEAWTFFQEVRAPADVLPGFVLTAGAAAWVMAWLADVAAFRLWTSFEAAIPSGTVFVFTSIFAADRGRTGAFALWFAAALAFTLLHRTARQHSSPSWLGSDPRLGTASILRVGSVIVVVAVGGSWVAGPRLPGVGDDPLWAPNELGSDDGSRKTVSPLVEIQGRLVEQSDVEVFTVRSTRRAYWRLTSLDEFDGSVWSSQGSYREADGELDDVGDPPPGSEEVIQQVTISGLSSIWLPAAFEPRAIDADAEVIFEPESSTLIVPRDQRTSNGLSYEIVSAVPTAATPEQLAGDDDPPGDVARDGTRLPPGFPASVTDEAARVVAGASTPYEQARALQDYFRNGEFTYTLDVPPGHSDSAIEEFLFVRKSGYCEQYAGTYAAMARAIGLPARVAVGFTPGEQDPADPDLYRVRGEHAHAWPEVWLPGAGWMPFEPTPGRGDPNATSYTGVPGEQDTAGPSTDPTTVPATNAPPVSQGPGATVPGATATTLQPPPPPGQQEVGGNEVGAEEEASSSTMWRWVRTAAMYLLVVAVAVGLGAAGLAAWRVVRRWRRRRSATSADEVARSAWADALEDTSIIGLLPRRYETPVEFARRSIPALGDDQLTELAELIERADYAPDGIDEASAERVRELADGIRETVVAATSTRARVLAAVDPRPPARRVRRTGPRPTGPRISISHRR